MTAVDHDEVNVPDQLGSNDAASQDRGTLEDQHRYAAELANMFGDAWHVLRRLKQRFDLPAFDNLAGGVDRTAELSPISHDDVMQWLNESLRNAACLAHSFGNQENTLAELREQPRRLR